ncbi:MAG: copper amine oxidase N-terminal domain-containing protein [bacterium]
MRYTLIFLVVGLLAATLAPDPTHAQAPVRVFVDGTPVQFDQPPIVIGSRVLVPLRGIFERMGATVTWEAATRTVIAVRGSTVVELVIGQQSARVNDRIVPLDTPAMIVRARTLVPLRFISESLGATVQYQEATRTVLIFTPGTQPVPPPPAPSPAAQTVTGLLVQVRRGSDNPAVVVEQENLLHRIFVTPDTAITRVNLTTNSGGSVSLNALRVGDQVEARLGENNRAERIRATFKIAFGRLDAVAGGGRTILLTNGQAYRVAESGVEIIIDDKSSTIANLKPGMILLLRLNPESTLVYGINAETASAQVPATRPARPILSEPDPGEVISSPVEVEGTAEGATKVLITIDATLGVRLAAVEAPVVNGRFSVNVTYQPLFPGWPYVITVIAVNSAGLESDPATVTVRQR